MSKWDHQGCSGHDLIAEIWELVQNHNRLMGGGGNEEEGYKFKIYPKGRGINYDSSNARDISKRSAGADRTSAS